MAEVGAIDDRPRLTLTAWALATLDVCLFVLLPLAAVYRVGALADLLSGLHTLAGVAVFVSLWALFLLAVCWVLSAGPLGQTSLRSLALRGFAAGAVLGITFLATLVAAVAALSASGPVGQFGALALLVVLSIAVAGVLGGAVGLAAGVLNVAVYRAAGALLPASATGPER